MRKQASCLWGVGFVWIMVLNGVAQKRVSAEETSYQIGESVPIQGFSNAKLKSVQADGIKILHDHGIALIPAEALSSALQSRYQFDSEEAMDRLKMEKTLKEERVRLAEFQKRAEASKLKVRGRIMQVFNDGILLQRASYLAGKELSVYHVDTGRSKIGTGPSLRYPDAVGVREVTKHESWQEVWTDLGDVIAVHCDPTQLMEGQNFTRVLYRNGHYTYTTVKKEENTVVFLTDNLEQSARFYRSQFGMSLQ